eukprot:352149-Chlamydomonas_euryale.AAC.11
MTHGAASSSPGGEQHIHSCCMAELHAMHTNPPTCCSQTGPKLLEVATVPATAMLYHQDCLACASWVPAPDVKAVSTRFGHIRLLAFPSYRLVCARLDFELCHGQREGLQLTTCGAVRCFSNRWDRRAPCGEITARQRSSLTDLSKSAQWGRKRQVVVCLRTRPHSAPRNLAKRSRV